MCLFFFWHSPEHTFESMEEELEKNLMAATEPFLRSLEATAKALCLGSSWSEIAGVTSGPAHNLANLICTYLRCFKEWKIADERKLAPRLQHAINELHKVLENPDTSSSLTPEVRAEMEAQIVRLNHKIKQIAGEGRSSSGSTGPQQKKRKLATVVLPTESYSPPAAADTAAATGWEMTNEQLAHELLLDPEFRLHTQNDPIRSAFDKGFWNSLADELNTEPVCSYARVFAALKDISR